MVFLLGLMSHAIMPESQEKPGVTPKLMFVPESRSLGIVPPYSVKMFELVVENKGDAELILKEAAPSCSCTAVSSAFEKVVKPGEKSRIRVTFNSRNFQGLVKKSVLVSSNDPAHPIKEFVFTAFVQSN
jgi:hypothetical protein